MTMKTVYYNEQVQLEPCVATIGFFDGVHRGHQFLIQHLVNTARKDGLASTVITFDQHPRKVLQSDYQPEMLSTLESKLLLLSKTEIDNAVVLPFSKEMAKMSARDFMRQVLRDHLHVKKLFIGYDHRFGHNREETFDDYVRYGKEMGIEVVQNTALDVEGIMVSSSVVRRLISNGDVETAAKCLGRYYSLHGIVTSGYHEGRKIGFPTANIDLGTSCLLAPAGGVYAVKVWLDGECESRVGMLNIGTRPTFGGNDVSIEVNIFGFVGDIYGQNIRVEFCKRIRSEHKFDNIDQLVAQLKKDKEEISKLF